MARSPEQDQEDEDQHIREICINLLNNPELLLAKNKDEAWLPLFIHVMVRFTELVPRKRMSAWRVAQHVALCLDDEPKKGAITRAYRTVAETAGISEEAVRKDFKRIIASLDDRTK